VVHDGHVVGARDVCVATGAGLRLGTQGGLDPREHVAGHRTGVLGDQEAADALGVGEEVGAPAAADDVGLDRACLVLGQDLRGEVGEDVVVRVPS
jgi:hypothetical protein